MSKQRLVRPIALFVVLAAVAVAIFAASPGGASPPSNANGVFVVGDITANAAGPTDTVTWWSHSWWLENALTGGAAPPAFKGYAVEFSTVTAPACGGTWTTGPGNSPHPPDSVDGTIPVIIASTITKSGNTISGNIVGLGTVTTNPGYGPNPGHPGTGTIVATPCPPIGE